MADLSEISKTGIENHTRAVGKKGKAAVSGGQVLGDEVTDHVIKVITELHSFNRSSVDPASRIEAE